MKTEKIGANAGVIWRTLHASDSDMSVAALINVTGLSMFEVSTAIGWLARENKIIIKETEEGCLLNVFKEYYY